jgi:hypothetical protein
MGWYIRHMGTDGTTFSGVFTMDVRFALRLACPLGWEK